MPIKKSPLVVFTRGEAFSVGDPFFIFGDQKFFRLAPLNNVKICCLFQKHGKRTTMHTPIHTFNTTPTLAYPQKGPKKKKEKKAGSIGCMLQFPICSSRIFILNGVHLITYIWQRLMAEAWIVGTECTRGPHPIESSKQHMGFFF